MRDVKKKERYYLYDGTEVTKDQLIQTARRYQGTYKGFGSIMVAGVLITTLAVANDFDISLWGYILALIIIDMTFLILSIYFFAKNKRMDLVEFGLSILNFRRRELLNKEANSMTHNNIEANHVIDLKVRSKQFIFFNDKTNLWQYRSGKYLSIPLMIEEIVSCHAEQIKVRLSHLIIALDDGSGVILHCSSQVIALSVVELLKYEPPEEEIVEKKEKSPRPW